MATDLSTLFANTLKQKTYAQQLAEQGASTAPTPSIGAALARALQGGLAGIYERGDDAEQRAAIDHLPGLGPSARPAQPMSAPMGTPNIAGSPPVKGGPLQYPDRIYSQDELSPLDAQVATPQELAAALKMNPVDFDKTARTVIGEAGNEAPVGQQAVANVILNRARLAGQTPSQVITPSQFEPYQSPEGRLRMSVGTNTPAYANAAQAVFAASQADPTGGATHFYSPSAQAALGRPAPSWDNGTGQDIGDQRFLQLPFAGQPAGSASATMALAPVQGQGNPIPEPKPAQVAQANAPITPQQPGATQGVPGRSTPAIPPEQAANIRRMLLSQDPQTKAMGAALYQQYMAPKETYNVIIGPDGRPMQQNSLTGELKPVPVEPSTFDVTYARQHWRELNFPDPQSTDPKSQNFWKEYNAKRLGGAGVNVSIDQSAPSEFEKEYGQGMGKRALDVINQGDTAANDLQRVNLTRTIMAQAKTGKLAPAQATIGAWAQSVGIDPAKLGIDPNLPILSEVGQSTMAQSVVQMIGSGGFPANNFSDADRKFLQSIPAGISNQPGSNELLSDIAERVAQRKFDKANAWADARANKQSYEEFERDWRKKVSQEDMFGDIRQKIQGMQAGQVSAPPPAKADDGWQTLPSGVRIREKK